MVNTMQDNDLKELQTLPWVAEARKTEDGYAVRTKPGAFQATLTHKIRKGRSAYDETFTSGSRLETPTVITLPEYWFYLGDQKNEVFKFSLVKSPPKVLDHFGMTPQYNQLTSTERWGVPLIPCYGTAPGDANSLYTYRLAKTWRDRANEVAIYLQSAVPHYSEPWYTTAYAYRLGIVGDEMLED